MEERTKDLYMDEDEFVASEATGGMDYSSSPPLSKKFQHATIRKQAKPLYQPIEKTMEYAEVNYYRQLNTPIQWSSLVPINAFWKDYANTDKSTPFVSPNFIYASNSFTEMMFALSG